MDKSPEVQAVIRVLETFRDLDPKITLPRILAILYAAELDNQSGNQAEVTERLSLTGATASRSLSYWETTRRNTVPGAGMIDSYPDPEHRSYKILSLTVKGLKFIETVKEAFHGPRARK